MRWCGRVSCVRYMLPPDDHLLRTLAAVPPDSRILDLGCGEGRHTEPLVRLGFDVSACDHDPTYVSAAKAAVAEVVGSEKSEAVVRQLDDPMALPYPDGRFDWIVAMESLDRDVSTREELVERLREAHRVLKPGGWIYVTLPSVPADTNPNEPVPGYAGDSGLHFTFTPELLDALMKEVEFAVAEEPVVVGQVVRGIYRKAGGAP
jgi:SAM-dependent methyltransferase